MSLESFVEQSLALADLRNLSVENPVVLRVNAPASMEEFQIVVAHKEPSFSVLPYNVTWIVADPQSANYKRALRRVTSLPFAPYRNTWEILTVLEDIWAVAQYYEYSGSFQIGEVQLNGITFATQKVRGTVKLLNNPVDTDPDADSENPVAISDNDPRMSDARTPTPHTHPLSAAEMLAGSAGVNEFYVTIKDGQPPVAGQTLVLTGAGDEPNEWMGYWRNLNQSDVDYNGPTFDDLEIYTSAVEFNEQQTYVFRANAKFSDDTTVSNVPALWSIVVGGSYSNISATTGTFNSNNIVGDQPVRIQAVWTHAPSGQSRTKTFEFTLKDVTVYRVLDRLVINGPASVNEGNSATYSVTAFYDDGTSQGVTPATFISSNAAAGTFNSTTGIFTAAQLVGNATTSISASFTENGVSKSATINVSVVDTTVYPVSASINGPATVDENSNATYSMIVSFSDNSSRAVSITNWASSNLAVATISPVSGVMNAMEVNGNQNVVVSGSYTSEGVTVNATKTVAVRDLTVYPSSANIIGNASVNEGTTTTYQFRVNFSDGTNLIVPVSNWASNNSTVATINATTGVLTAAADVKPDQTTVISASYTSEGVTVSDNRTITVKDVTVYPVSAVILGAANIDEATTAALQLQVTYTDGSVTIVPAKSWSSSDTNLATVNTTGTVTVATNVVGNQTFTITATYELNGEEITSQKTFTVVDRTSYPVSATIVGPASVNEGTDTQYDLSVTFADTTVRVVTASSWTFSNAAAGSVSSSGLFTSVANTQGNKSGQLSASYTLDGTTVNANRTLTIVDSTKYPQSATISGPATINEGQTGTYQLSVTFSDNSTSFVPVTNWAITAGSEWGSIDAATGVLTIVPDVTLGDKSITITASHTVDGATATGTRTITAKDLTVYPQSIEITGANSITEGTVGAYAAMVTYTDDSLVDKTTDVTWSLSDTTYASIAANGNVTVSQITGGNKTTTINVTFTENGVTRTASKTVTLTDATVYPQSAAIIGASTFNEGDAAVQYILRVTKTDASTEDVTVTTWQTSNVNAGTLLNDGTFTPAASVTGADLTTVITATYTLDGVTVTGTLNVNVKDATVYPASARILGADSIDENSSSIYTLEVTFTDATVSVIPVNSWALADSTYATIDAAGEVTTLSVTGNQTIQVQADYTSNGQTVNATKNVTVVDTSVYVSSIAITGPSQVTEGSSVNFTATATYADSSTQPVTATWSLDTTDYGTIDSSGAFTPAANIVGDHSVVVTASYTESGVTVTNTRILLVKDAQLYPVSIAILAPTSLNEGQTSALQCRVTYNNSSVVTATSGVTWSVDNGSYGSVDVSGVLTAAQVAGGNKTLAVTAQYTENGLNFTKTVNVTIVDTTLYPQTLAITGPNQVNETTNGHQFSATVTYQDSSTTNVTTASGITWSASSGTIGAKTGIFNAPTVSSNQNVTITATYLEAGQTVSKTFTVQVLNVVIVPQSVAITGPTSVSPSGTANYVATVTYSDSTTAVRTASGSWGRSNAAAGSIGATTGVFTAAAVSSTTATNITFSYTENGATVNATYPINVVVAAVPIARFGKGQFAGLDFTGGKDDGQNGGMNLEGQPYQQWTGPQHFFNSVLTNQMASNTSGLTFSLNLPTGADYGYFAHPSSLGTATHIDQSTMWPGGWDGATWETDGNFGETAGPIEVTIDDGSGPRLWKIYRTDFSGIGQYTWAVNYS